MSDQEIVIVGKRKTNRLNLDSEEEARLEAEEQARLDEIRQRKQQKRRRREEEARREEEQAKKKQEQQQKYQNPQTMLMEDSNSNDSFSRVEKKIRKSYPEFRAKEESSKRRHVSESEDSEEQQDQQSESESESKPKKKGEKKVKRERRAEDSEEVRQPRQKVEKVKLEEEDPKERLVKEVAIRWWYCLPEWPPSNFPYEEELRKLGYRLVDQTRFRMQQNLVNGLLKATTIDGYVGIFKTKQKLLDIRPKEIAPSLRLLRSKTMEQLTALLRISLKEQVLQLSSQKYHQHEELQLLHQLQRRLNEIS